MAGAFWLAWMLLAQINFAYPLWYELLSIDETIAVYAPQNRNRRHFERTDKAERERLFAALVQAIHENGHGLLQLSYRDPAGKPIARMLTAAEIVHLQDVARLVERGRLFGWLSLGAWLLASAWLVINKIQPPALKRCIFIALSAMLVLTLIVLITGPVRLFYQLHEWVFPQGHQWFFYYQDSLMTTLLKAPDIFAAIALLWLAVSFPLWLIMIAASRYLTGRRLAAKNR